MQCPGKCLFLWGGTKHFTLCHNRPPQRAWSPHCDLPTHYTVQDTGKARRGRYSYKSTRKGCTRLK
jgi:hypothetical protein